MASLTASLRASACSSRTSSSLAESASRHDRERSFSKRSSMWPRALSSSNLPTNRSAIFSLNPSEAIISAMASATHSALRSRYFSSASPSSLSSDGITLPRTPFSSSLRSMYSMRRVSGRMALSSKRAPSTPRPYGLGLYRCSLVVFERDRNRLREKTLAQVQKLQSAEAPRAFACASQHRREPDERLALAGSHKTLHPQRAPNTSRSTPPRRSLFSSVAAVPYPPQRKSARRPTSPPRASRTGRPLRRRNA